jgi:mannose-6-phosphate isomerase
MDIAHRRARVRAFIDTSLRLWSSAGYDPDRRTFIEALDFEGAPLANLQRRGRVQARQIYVYALAHRFGFDPNGTYLRIAEEASESAEAIYRHESGGWVFSADPTGKVLRADCYAYEQSFRIMSLAALGRATGKPQYVEQLDRAWQWIESLRHPSQAGFVLGRPISTPLVPREQNPHMHLFEACQEAAPIDPAKWTPRAAELFRLAIDRFISPEGALVEFFGEDWTPDAKLGADIQPGHHCEWTWLLTQYAKLSGDTSPKAETLYDNAMAWGLDANGLGLDEVRSGGGVLRGTKRLWVQCEVLKAHLARFETLRDELYLVRAGQVVDGMFEHYLMEKVGTWYDQVDESNANMYPNATASSLYHVLIALNEFLRVTA